MSLRGIRAEHRRAGDRGGLRGHRADASGSTRPSSASSSRSSRWPAEPGSSSTSHSGRGQERRRGSPSCARVRRGVRPARRARPLGPVGARDRADRRRARARLAPGRQLPRRTRRSPTAGSRSRRSGPSSCSGAAGTSSTLLAPGAVAGALLLIGGPWVWRLALERDAERTARIRSEERSDVAARVHDSVLQTLALIQRHADEPRRVAALARRQERELRGWLYGDQPLGDETASLVAALAAAAGDVEELHGVRVELASAGDCPVDAVRGRARPRGARGDDERGEVRRRRGDRRLRRGDRRRRQRLRARPRRGLRPRRRARTTGEGIAESIEGRMERAGGRATIVTSPGERHRGRAAPAAEGVVKRRVVLVDDHDLFLAGVRAELGDAVEVVGQAGTRRRRGAADHRARPRRRPARRPPARRERRRDRQRGRAGAARA